MTSFPGRPTCPALLALLVTVLGLSLLADDAGAANTRVSIGDFQWSKDPEIDLGEKVIWHWVGPDTAHSVTGRGPGGVLVDSDPMITSPNHPIGDTFEYTFDQPGTYSLACKLHGSVRGTVSVSEEIGDPDSDPGPSPEVFWDEEPPQLDEVFVLGSSLGSRGLGGKLSFAVSEFGLADAEYYRMVRQGKGKRARLVRRFTGYSEWPTYIGYNVVRYGARSSTFPAQPGPYVGLLRVTDGSGNIAGPVEFRFEIAKPKGPKKKIPR